MALEHYKHFLEQQGIVFEEGLSEEETVLIEQKYDFKFPPDLREFLSLGLPVSDDFINWRSDSEKSIRGRLDWPYDSMCLMKYFKSKKQQKSSVSYKELITAGLRILAINIAKKELKRIKNK